MPELVGRHSDEEEIFAIDYDIVQIHKLLHDYLMIELKIQLSIQTMKVILMKLEEVLIILMLVLVVISLIL